MTNITESNHLSTHPKDDIYRTDVTFKVWEIEKLSGNDIPAM